MAHKYHKLNYLIIYWKIKRKRNTGPIFQITIWFETNGSGTNQAHKMHAFTMFSVSKQKLIWTIVNLCYMSEHTHTDETNVLIKWILYSSLSLSLLHYKNNIANRNTHFSKSEETQTIKKGDNMELGTLLTIQYTLLALLMFPSNVLLVY